ncbi:MAG TPA: peptide-methionine (S)-S-oxide reductase MsrA [Planctomicrobium sp.]|nr:peptide-methionine (S)-S-oxide reductase MsrA [Planctomicrobium sp.]
MTTSDSPPETMQATFGSGCFWCTEAIFLSIPGVQKVVSGYSGGHVEHPTYQNVCTGKTGHAEVIRITFDPKEASFETLLGAFFSSHDPTTLDRQGNDVGTQYRSVIFYHDESQKVTAEKIIHLLTEQQIFDSPIVTEVSPVMNFYPAEGYHQNYYALHGHEPYCQLVIRPKLEKFRHALSLQEPLTPPETNG